MKELRFFYVPNPENIGELPEDAAAHAVRVLRMAKGDDLVLADGKGFFYKAVVTESDKRHCYYRILEKMEQEKEWTHNIHIAMAPTKNADRTEWFVEKATEIGFDELTFLDCRFSERRKINIERVDRIIISAMMQSRKAEKPLLHDIIKFEDFVKTPFAGSKYICHCYDNAEFGEKVLLQDVLNGVEDAIVMIGPEGDFSIDEVRLAIENGFESASLGSSRLRTETAALVAVHLMRLKL